MKRPAQTDEIVVSALWARERVEKWAGRTLDLNFLSSRSASNHFSLSDFGFSCVAPPVVASSRGSELRSVDEALEDFLERPSPLELGVVCGSSSWSAAKIRGLLGARFRTVLQSRTASARVQERVGSREAKENALEVLGDVVLEPVRVNLELALDQVEPRVKERLDDVYKREGGVRRVSLPCADGLQREARIRTTYRARQSPSSNLDARRPRLCRCRGSSIRARGCLAWDVWVLLLGLPSDVYLEEEAGRYGSGGRERASELKTVVMTPARTHGYPPHALQSSTLLFSVLLLGQGVEIRGLESRTLACWVGEERTRRARPDACRLR